MSTQFWLDVQNELEEYVIQHDPTTPVVGDFRGNERMLDFINQIDFDEEVEELQLQHLPIYQAITFGWI